MEYFQNKKFTFITLALVATIGFSIFSLKDSENKSDYNISETPTSRSQSLSSRTEHQNRPRRSETTRQNKNTGDKQLSSRNENVSPTEAAISARAEALAREEELAKAQQQCNQSNLDEVAYVSEAYNQNAIDSASAQQQIIYFIKTCTREQVASMVENIFNGSDDVMHSMSLLLEILPNMERTLSIINAIKQQDFSHDDMQQLIAMTADQPTGVKQALVPSIVRNDDLDSFLLLTQNDNFFNSIEDRTGSYPTAIEADNMIQNLIMSQRHDIPIDGEIYNHVLSTYPNSTTHNQLIKIALSQDQ
ncbi:MAG: hypothetical protein OEY29_15680 [Gammaproteobacteria bacterium]|nr:hypothetical protein [Gammaproteobacteria bacterium]